MTGQFKRKKSKKIIHIEYIRVYHEILKFEEVIDIDIDRIFQAYLKLLADVRKIKNLSKPPTRFDIDCMVDLLLMKLKNEPMI